jgi:hypothetical protein
VPANPTAARKEELVAELTAKLTPELRKRTKQVQEDIDFLCVQEKTLQEGEDKLTRGLQALKAEKVPPARSPPPALMHPRPQARLLSLLEQFTARSQEIGAWCTAQEKKEKDIDHLVAPADVWSRQ